MCLFVLALLPCLRYVKTEQLKTLGFTCVHVFISDLPTNLFRIVYSYEACILCARHSVGMSDMKSSHQRSLAWSRVSDRTLTWIILT